MTQEEKQLLLKDLCARLLYGLVFQSCHSEHGIEGKGTFDFEIGDDVTLSKLKQLCELNNNKPYLRPMSSMTEEEKKELSAKYNWSVMGNDISIRYHSEGYWDDDTECLTNEYLKLFDWLNAHHFDYRGLIEMGLALEAPEGMYN